MPLHKWLLLAVFATTQNDVATRLGENGFHALTMVVSRVSGAEGMVASMSTKTKQRVQVEYVVKMHLTNRQREFKSTQL